MSFHILEEEKAIYLIILKNFGVFDDKETSSGIFLLHILNVISCFYSISIFCNYLPPCYILLVSKRIRSRQSLNSFKFTLYLATSLVLLRSSSVELA